VLFADRWFAAGVWVASRVDRKLLYMRLIGFRPRWIQVLGCRFSWIPGILAALGLHCVFDVGAALQAQANQVDSPVFVLISRPAPPDVDGFTFEVHGSPGEYAVHGSASLGSSWEVLTNVIVLDGTGATMFFPFLATDTLFLRAERVDSIHDVIFQTMGSSFEPEITHIGEEESIAWWTWSDGTTSTEYPVASKTFDSASSRFQRLKVDPAESLTKINLGFDGADGGHLTPLEHRPPQAVGAVLFSRPLTNLQVWASSYNPISNRLDFGGFTNLEYIEAYKCTQLRQVHVSHLPMLKRVCLEACNLQELDLSGNPNLEDVRAALNSFTNIVLGAGTGPKIWHWCVRDNPQLTQRFQDVMTNFDSLEDFWAWNTNQEGHLSLVSTNLIDVRAFRNRYTSVDLSGHDKLRVCRLYENQITNVVLTGCTALRQVDLHDNRLSTAALDQLLGELDRSAPDLRHLDLSQNPKPPSEVGLEHYANLLSRGVTVLLDMPDENDGEINVPGGTNAITFVTISENPILEIRTEGVPESIIWHWGDGTVTRNVHVATHQFESEGVWTNYVEVIPPDAVTYFGAPRSQPGQGIQAVYGAANFPNLDFLYLFTEDLTELSIAGCANLRQLHLARTLVSTEVCDQWFIDLDQAVTGPVTGADFWYPADLRSSASDAAWSSLVEKGFVMRPY
jgi:Leucine-rich repeat (LRR) protein